MQSHVREIISKSIARPCDTAHGRSSASVQTHPFIIRLRASRARVSPRVCSQFGSDHCDIREQKCSRGCRRRDTASHFRRRTIQRRRYTKNNNVIADSFIQTCTDMPIGHVYARANRATCWRGNATLWAIVQIVRQNDYRKRERGSSYIVANSAFADTSTSLKPLNCRLCVDNAWKVAHFSLRMFIRAICDLLPKSQSERSVVLRHFSLTNITIECSWYKLRCIVYC